MRISCTLLLLCLVGNVVAQVAVFPKDSIQNIFMAGKIVSLNGKWDFKYCPNVDEIPEGFEKIGSDLSGFSKIDVPSEWQIKGYDTPIYTNTNYPYALESKFLPMIPHVYGHLNSVE